VANQDHRDLAQARKIISRPFVIPWKWGSSFGVQCSNNYTSTRICKVYYNPVIHTQPARVVCRRETLLPFDAWPSYAWLLALIEVPAVVFGGPCGSFVSLERF
jgi:hypothetical protein